MGTHICVPPPPPHHMRMRSPACCRGTRSAAPQRRSTRSRTWWGTGTRSAQARAQGSSRTACRSDPVTNSWPVCHSPATATTPWSSCRQHREEKQVRQGRELRGCVLRSMRSYIEYGTWPLLVSLPSAGNFSFSIEDLAHLRCTSAAFASGAALARQEGG